MGVTRDLEGKPKKKELYTLAGYGKHAEGFERSVRAYANYVGGYSPEKSNQVMTALQGGLERFKEGLTGRAVWKSNVRVGMGEDMWGEYQSWMKSTAIGRAVGGMPPMTVMFGGTSPTAAEKQRRKRRKHYGSSILAGGGQLGVATTYRRQILGG